MPKSTRLRCATARANVTLTMALVVALSAAGCTATVEEAEHPDAAQDHHHDPEAELEAWDEVAGRRLRAMFGLPDENDGGPRAIGEDGGTGAPPMDAGTARPTMDAGTPPPMDAGTPPPADAGSAPPIDAGSAPPIDAGSAPPPIDAGATPPPPMDAGTTAPPPMDAGTPPPPPMDAGTDAGPPPPMDAGTSTPPPVDAGTDAGPPPPLDAGTDAGPPPPLDAGTDAGTDAGPAPPPSSSGLPLDRCIAVHVPDQLFTGEVALTFDDGPHLTHTPSIVATLRAHNAPATFFIQGNMVTSAAARAILDDMVADPDFIIANHTVTHPASPHLDEMSTAMAEAEIDDVETILRARGETHRYFRFPYFRATCDTMQMIRERSLTPVGAHVDSADWCFSGGTPGVCTWSAVPPAYQMHGMIDFILDQLAMTNGGIVLLHDIHAYTASQLDPLLTAIEDAGYRFVALDDTTVFPRLNEERFLGDACRDDADCAFHADAYCHAAGFCTMACDGTCPTQHGWATSFCGVEGAGGVCMPRPGPLNRHCNDVWGTAVTRTQRYAAGAPVPGDFEHVCAPAAP